VDEGSLQSIGGLAVNTRRRSRPDGDKRASREIRPTYSVAPDDDLYGSPRSWNGAMMEESATPHALRTDLRRDGDGRLRRPPFPSDVADERSSLWGMQWIGAVFLVGAVFLFAHSAQPFATAVGQHVRDAFAEDLTSIDLPPAVARAFGVLPSSGTAQVTMAVPDLQVVLPVRGDVIQQFSAVSPEIVLQSRPGSAVLAAAEGLVDSAGDSQASGYYVTIDHGSLGQTLYSHLGSLRVHAQEYVTAGEILGYLPSKSGQLTFGYIRSGAYQNPVALLRIAKP